MAAELTVAPERYGRHVRFMKYLTDQTQSLAFVILGLVPLLSGLFLFAARNARAHL